MANGITSIYDRCQNLILSMCFKQPFGNGKLDNRKCSLGWPPFDLIDPNPPLDGQKSFTSWKRELPLTKVLTEVYPSFN